MREFGWTERQLLDEVTVERLEQIQIIMNIEGEVHKAQMNKAKAGQGKR
jgi:hypothetical protein